MSGVLENYPLDDVDLDQKVNDVLGVPGVSSRAPEDGPGIRYSKYVFLDLYHARRIEFFVEARLDRMPKSLIDGYQIGDDTIVTGVMMRKKFGETADGQWRTVEQYIPEERFIEEFLIDSTAKIRAYRWFAENVKRARFDEETIDSINTQFLPTLTEDPLDNPFKKVFQ